MSNKTKCYNCKHRGTIPGDAHTMCCHPATGLNKGANVFSVLTDTLMGLHEDAREQLNITGDPAGIRGGWFMWPANFDPVWLLSCTGFTEHEATP